MKDDTYVAVFMTAKKTIIVPSWNVSACRRCLADGMVYAYAEAKMRNPNHQVKGDY